MRGQDIIDAAIETFHHPVRLRSARFGQAVLNTQRSAQLIKFMFATGLLLLVEQPVRELAAIVGQHGPDVAWRGLLQAIQERLGGRSRLVGFDLHEHPARRPVDGNEQIAPGGFIGYFWQVFDVNVKMAMIVGFEGLAGFGTGDGLPKSQTTHAMAVQATIQPRTGYGGVEEFTDHQRQVIQSELKDLA